MNGEAMRQPPPGIRAVLLDMDGVLFHGDRALTGADAFLRVMADFPHCFVTNNPIRTPKEIAAHFAAIGLPSPGVDWILTSAQATAHWLAAEKPGFRYFAVGARGLHEELARVGREDPRGADYVVVGEGPGLDYDTLTTGLNLLLKADAQLVCTNPDNSVDATLRGEHRVLPGGGALVAPFAVASGRQPVFIGKPYPLLYRMAMRLLQVEAGECVMIGDRPDTDILGAQRLGMRTALVRTGRFLPGEALPDGVLPDWDCADLDGLMSAWDWV